MSDPTEQLVFAHAARLELDTAVERQIAAAIDRLEAAGHRAMAIEISDERALEEAMQRAAAVCAVGLRPIQGDIMVAALLARCAVPLVLWPAGHDFCAVGTGACSGCRIRKHCPSSDRVAVYGELFARADAIAFRDDVQRALAERYLGDISGSHVGAAIEDVLIEAANRAPKPPTATVRFDRFLLWAHHLGLGDVLNPSNTTS